MFCIVVKGQEGEPRWVVRRSVELLSYHSSEKVAEILFLLHLENQLPNGEPNWLEVLHPGYTDYEVLSPWPFPSHVDEEKIHDHIRDERANILASVYGRGLEEDSSGRLRHVAGLAPWDSWFRDLECPHVTIWPKEEGIRLADAMERLPFPTPLARGEPRAAFTVFKLGPFRKKGLTLLAFKLRISGQTYRELVEADKVFTVDGPETLLLRIARKYVPRMSSPAKWLHELQRFETYVDIGESYDVILLRQGSRCEQLRTVRECGIVEAPLQPSPDGVAVRYVTGNPRFCLSLAYAKDMEEAETRQAVGLI